MSDDKPLSGPLLCRSRISEHLIERCDDVVRLCKAWHEFRVGFQLTNSFLVVLPLAGASGRQGIPFLNGHVGKQVARLYALR